MIQADDMTVDSHLTYIGNDTDVPYLRSVLPDVIMRLYLHNAAYRGVVMAACNHLSWVCTHKLEGYKLPHGMSGANIGIPWNIIAISRNRDSAERRHADVMINPHYIALGGAFVETESNCGSIRLPKPIKVRRAERVTVGYYTMDGQHHEDTFDRAHGSFTIQHEIDHNLGRLITDVEIRADNPLL